MWALAIYEFGGHIEEMAGDQEAAERSFREEYELHRRMGDEGHGSTSAAYLAVALCRLGRFDEAEELATIARTTGAEDDLATQASALRPGAGQVRTGEHEEARRLAGGRGPLRRGAESLVLRGLPDGARRSLARRGLLEQAAEAARAALAAYERKGHEPGWRPRER